MVALITAVYIQEFFGYLDHTIPGMKGTVKMHLIEHHVSQWVDMRSAGFGLMGDRAQKLYTTISVSCTGHTAVWLTTYRG